MVIVLLLCSAFSSCISVFCTFEMLLQLSPFIHMIILALYPDPLLSQVLVATTYPLEVVQAFQWVQKNPG